MFAPARKSVQAQLVTRSEVAVDYERFHPADDDPGLLLPGQYTFQDLCNHLIGSTLNLERDTENLIILELCLQCRRERLVREPGDIKYAKLLLSWISTSIRPMGHLIVQDEILQEDEEAAELALACSLEMSMRGVESIREILEEADVGEAGFDLLLSLVVYTNVEDAWTSDQLCKESVRILHGFTNQVVTYGFIIEYLLNDFIRPLFSNSKPSSITTQGRKSINPDPTANRHFVTDRSDKPWKFEQVSTVTVFNWVVEHSDEAMIYKSWHLFIPPLLTLLDDNSTSIRVSGLQILKKFLGIISGKVLRQTGLGDVFEGAVMPTLLFLPSLTPLDESLRLLAPAYEVLFVLGDVRFPTKDDKKEKIKFLDKIMRQGLLQGIEHCRGNLKILGLLLSVMSTLMVCMGIHAVKHLKDTIPTLSTTLADPFGPANPDFLIVATKAMQNVILNCWPRLREPVHCLEIVKALALCWTNINEAIELHGDERNVKLDSVKKELKVAGTMLVKSVEGTIKLSEELAPLLNANGALGELFSFYEAP